MQRIKQYERDLKLVEYLATPVPINGEILRDNKGNLFYPTLKDAHKKFNLAPEVISKKKHKNWELFTKLKDENEAKY